MITRIRTLLGCWLVVSTLALAVPVTGAAEIQTGDGIGTVQAYNMATKTVTIGKIDVPLLAQAAVSLEQQLAGFNWSGTKPFNAKYNVVQDSVGRHVIESIYVYPPKLR